MNGFQILGDMGKYVSTHPTETMAVGIAGATGLSLMGGAIAHPQDTAMNAIAFANEPDAVAAGGAILGGMGIMAAGAYGIEASLRNKGFKGSVDAVKGRYNSVKSFSNRMINKIPGPVRRFTKATGGAIATGARGIGYAANPGNVAASAVKTYGAAWDMANYKLGPAGWKFMAGGSVLAGVGFGFMKASFSMGLNAGEYESAMARSEEGSAYEGGPGAFGAGKTRVRSMGQSTMGMVQGMHNGRR